MALAGPAAVEAGRGVRFSPRTKGKIMMNLLESIARGLVGVALIIASAQACGIVAGAVGTLHNAGISALPTMFVGGMFVVALGCAGAALIVSAVERLPR